MSYYPCSCSPCTDCSSSTPSCPSGDCLQVASLTIFGNSSILPCGSSFTTDVGAASDLSICTTTVNWGIVSYDEDAFTNVAVDSDGVVTGTTTTAMELNTFYEILGKAVCTTTLLSQYFKVRISVRNACLDAAPCEDPDQVCNPCTGTCIDAPDSELD
jgi:hypothetical protein